MLASDWITTNFSLIGADLLQHVELTLIAVGIGFAISIPLAVLIWRIRILRPAVLGFSAVLYTVPSIALFALIQPVTGYFSTATAEVALVSYTLLIFIRTTVTGLDGIDPDVRDAARGMGYSPLAQLMRVDLPLALPAIIAALRVATVTVIGLVTVTAFIGQGGLGQLILYGFNGSGIPFDTPIIVGLVLSVLLAGIADRLLDVLRRIVVPWTRVR